MNSTVLVMNSIQLNIYFLIMKTQNLISVLVNLNNINNNNNNHTFENAILKW